jgi:hypothetical protein
MPDRTVYRTGRSLGRTIYRQVGEGASKADQFMGIMDTTADAEVGAALNALPLPPCGATAVFWSYSSADEAECYLPRGHQPGDIHESPTLGQWREDDLPTSRPIEILKPA